MPDVEKGARVMVPKLCAPMPFGALKGYGGCIQCPLLLAIPEATILNITKSHAWAKIAKTLVYMNKTIMLYILGKVISCRMSSRILRSLAL